MTASLVSPQVATETREAVREQERRSGSRDHSASAERPQLQGLSCGNSAGPSASNDTQGSGGQSGGGHCGMCRSLDMNEIASACVHKWM